MTIRDDIFDICSRHNFLWASSITDEILKLFAKKMQDLEMEYRKRQIFELEYKVVFEDIQDILDGKTFEDIFW